MKRFNVRFDPLSLIFVVESVVPIFADGTDELLPIVNGVCGRRQFFDQWGFFRGIFGLSRFIGADFDAVRVDGD